VRGLLEAGQSVVQMRMCLTPCASAARPGKAAAFLHQQYLAAAEPLWPRRQQARVRPRSVDRLAYGFRSPRRPTPPR
jgi:hypothetical protein